MRLDDALRLSSVRVAVRPEIINLHLALQNPMERKRVEKETRAWNQPAVSSRNLIKFHHQTQEPVYATRIWTRQGRSVALALELRLPRDDWDPIDPSDMVTALGDLLTRIQIVERQRRIIDRKELLGLTEGSEWKCKWLHEVLGAPDAVAARTRLQIERAHRFRKRG